MTLRQEWAFEEADVVVPHGRHARADRGRAVIAGDLSCAGPAVLAVNKLDNPSDIPNPSFYSLGEGVPMRARRCTAFHR